MPGFGLGLCMGQNLALEQRLEQRLSLCLKLSQLGAMDTEGGRDAAHELAITKTVLKDLDGSVYTDVKDFIERVGKRVSKAKRTEGTREIVSALRTIVKVMNLSLSGVRAVVATSITVGDHLPISDELSGLAKVISSESTAQFELRELVFGLWQVGALCEEGYLNFLPLFSEACERLALTPEAFTELLRPFVGSEQFLRPRYVDVVQQSFCEAVDIKASSQDVALSVEILLAHEHLLGHLHTVPPIRSMRQLLTSQVEWPVSLPTIFRLTLLEESEATCHRLVDFCAEESFGREIDRQRHILAAGLMLDSIRYRGFFARLISLSGNSRELAELCQAAVHVMRGGHGLSLPDSAASFSTTLEHLRNETASAFVRLPFNDGYRAKLASELDRISPEVLQPVISLAGIYEKTYPEGLPLLARLMEHVIDRDFSQWRYNHEAATEQLKPVRACKAWQDNMVRTRVLGRRDEIASRLSALHLLAPEAHAVFAAMFNREWTPGLASALETQILSFDSQFRSPNLDGLAKKNLGIEKSRLIVQNKAARMLELFTAAETDLVLALSVFKERLREPWIGLLSEVMKKAVTILEASGLSNDRVLTMIETDLPVYTLNVGVKPVQSCQRWTEVTGYNNCLLAYVLDPNKKVWQFSTRLDACIGRVVVRMLPFKKSALLLLEPPYSVKWSDDHTVAFLLTVIEKAGAISREIKKPVYVGFVGGRKRSEDYYRAFELVAHELNGKLLSVSHAFVLPPSLNGHEYSDALGGHLASGASLDEKEITYIIVDTAAEDAAG